MDQIFNIMLFSLCNNFWIKLKKYPLTTYISDLTKEQLLLLKKQLEYVYASLQWAQLKSQRRGFAFSKKSPFQLILFSAKLFICKRIHMA